VDGLSIMSATTAWLKSTSFSLLSPVTIFSFMIGAGLVGTLLGPLLPVALVIYAAILGALVFNFGFTLQIMKLVLRFAGKPSEGLEGLVSEVVVAETAFDAEGKGLVKATLDGQTIQILAHLDPTDVHKGLSVARGESVTILEVDGKSNRCRVTKELSD
jgi:hypothetical protein